MQTRSDDPGQNRLFESAATSNISQAAAFFSRESGKLALYNHAFTQLTGYTRKDLAGKQFSDFIHPRDLSLVQKRLKNLIRRKLSEDIFEIRVLTKDNQTIYVEITALSQIENKRLQGVEVFIRDITQRKIYEKALLRQNKELKLLNSIAEIVSQTLSLDELLKKSLDLILKNLEFDAGSICVFDHISEKISKFVEVGSFNPQLQEFTNKKFKKIQEEALNLPQSVLTFSRNRSKTKSNLILHEIFAEIDYQAGAIIILHSKDKVWGVLMLWKKGTSQFDRKDIKLLVSIGSQIGMAIENTWLYEQTDLKLQERIKELAAINSILNAIRQTVNVEERLSLALKSLLEVMKLEQGAIFIVSKNGLEVILKSHQGLTDAITKNFSRLPLNQTALRVLEDESKRVFDSRTIPFWHRSLRTGLIDESIKRLLVISFRTKNKLLGFCCLVATLERQLTCEESSLLESLSLQIGVAIENARLYDEAQVRQRELQQKNQELENFIYLISHDLKTPVISIQGLIDIFLAESERRLTRSEKKYFDAIQASANRMESLIKNLLEFARLGQAILNFEYFKTNELMDELEKEFQFKAEQKNVKLKLNKSIPEIYGDRLRLKLAISNLIDNGINYAKSDTKSYVKFWCEKQEYQWLFCVEDNGIGIAKRFHQRIFQPFERLTREPPGSGLGLAMVQRIIQMHEGKIWVESDEGAGSKFYFTLPIP
jgi:PAS domain S-box-containing protein